MIDKTINVCRFVYNLALETKIWAYKSQRIHLSSYDLQKQFTQLRKEYEWIKEVGYVAPKETVKNIDSAFNNFFNGSKFPKFKNKYSFNSFKSTGSSLKINWIKSTLNVSIISNLSIVLSNRFNEKIRSVVISRTPTKKYFASILVKTEQQAIIPPKSKTAVGIDLGIKDFAVLSTGEKIANPRYLQSELKRLKVLHRRASRKKKDSNNSKKAKLKVALLYEKITNQRQDFLHKLSTKLISDSQTDTICVEDLAVKNMIQNRNLTQAISDVSWGEFVRQLEYKGKWYGKNIIKINRFYASSKTCSNCGHKYDELNLSERTWQCSNCDANHDRDINAAINIRNSGMGSPGGPAELSSLEEAKKQEVMSTCSYRAIGADI